MEGNWTVTKIIAIILLIILVIWFIGWIFKKKPVPANNQPTNQPINAPSNNAVASPNNLSNTPFVLYYFYSQSCPHCINFAPAWNEIVNRLKNIKGLSIRTVDTNKPENEKLAFYYNITGSPTVILVTPDNTLEYSGNRSASDVYNFVVTNLQPYGIINQ